MPLIKSSSKSAMGENIKREIAAGKPQKQAVAIALDVQRRNRAGGGLIPRYDVGGPTPTRNPNISGYLQNLSQMSPDQLRVIALRSPGTPQGQMAAQVLQKKLLMPNAGGAASLQQPQGLGLPAQAPAQPGLTPGAQQPATAPLAPYASAMAGGGRLGFAAGGSPSMSMMAPWFTRAEERGAATGYYRGPTPGRADEVNAAPPAGSYVLPADVVAHFGQGNSDAGAGVIERALSTYPYGTHQAMRPSGSAYTRIPPPPHDPELMRGVPGEARGGPATGNVPVKVSHGEVLVLPQTVRRLGGGDLRKGHKLLDAFVLKARAAHIATLKKLPGPAKS